jgi:hypothetical protein
MQVTTFPLDDRFVSLAVVGRVRPPLWYYETWQQVVSALEPLTAEITGDLSVRSTQGLGKEDVKFGRLGWNDKSHRKWTHDSPETRGRSHAWGFAYGDALAPSASACARQRRAPCFFCSFANPFVIRPPRAGQFNQFFHLALPMSDAQPRSVLVVQVVMEIARILNASHTLGRAAPWLERGECVLSTINNCLGYLGQYNDDVFDPSKTHRGLMPGSPWTPLAEFVFA